MTQLKCRLTRTGGWDDDIAYIPSRFRIEGHASTVVNGLDSYVFQLLASTNFHVHLGFGVRNEICLYNRGLHWQSEVPEKKPVIVVSSPVRNITPPVTGARKTGRYYSWGWTFLGHAVGSYPKGKML